MPEINFGRVKGEPFRYEDFTPEQLEGLRGYKGDKGVRGTKWYSGNKISGALTTENVFSNSEITDAMVEDHYVNTDNGEVYICTLGGDSNTAKWKFVDRLLVTDKSLTKQNVPADAKEVGNKITEINEHYNLLNEKAVEVEKKHNELSEKTAAYLPLTGITNFEMSKSSLNPSNATHLLNCDGNLVALCGRELYISTDDGESWEIRKYMSSGAYITFISIAYGNGTYVLVDNKNKVYTTSDLNIDVTSWRVTSKFGTGSNTPTHVVFDNNMFVLFLYNNKPAISSDGISWEYEAYTISNFNITKAIFAKDKWICISTGTRIFIFEQDDLKNPTVKLVSDINSNFALIADIIYIKELDKIYACGANNTASSGGFGIIASSTDMLTTFEIEHVESSFRPITSIAYSNNVLVAIGCDTSGNRNSSYVCCVGDTWKKLDSDLSFNSYKFKHVVFGKNRFVTVGENYTKYANFNKKEMVLNDVTSNMLVNENKESFNFGYKNGEHGFYTNMERKPDSFFPFIQNVPRIIDKGTVEYGDTYQLNLETGNMYMLFVQDITTATGVLRAYRTYVVYTTELVDKKKSIGNLVKVGIASGGTSALKITDIKTTQRIGFDIASSNAAYHIEYSLIKLT